MSLITRRSFLVCSTLGTQVWLAGCTGFDQDAEESSNEQALGSPTAPSPAPSPAPAAPTPPPALSPDWNVKAGLTFVAGAEAVVDLSDTLPPGIQRGGKFEVDDSGTPLPPGATLSADGKFTVAAVVAMGMTDGIVFAYTAP